MTYGRFLTIKQRFWEIALNASETNYRAFNGVCEAEEALDLMTALVYDTERLESDNPQEKNVYENFLTEAEAEIEKQSERYNELLEAPASAVAYWLDVDANATQSEIEARQLACLPEGFDSNEALGRDYVDGKGGIENLDKELLENYFNFNALGDYLRSQTETAVCDGNVYYFWKN